MRQYQSNFPGSKQKVDQARVLIAALKSAKSAIEFEADFAAVINAERSVLDNLRSEGAKFPGFRDWHDSKLAAMRADDLLRFIHQVRIDTFHKGNGIELFVWPAAFIKHLSTKDIGPPPDEDTALTIGVRGPEWVVHPGKPEEYHVPILSGGSWQVQVGLKDAPSTHLGRPLQKRDPISIVTAALKWFEETVVEAEKTFGRT